jgi:molybdate transport system permease protein
MDLLTTLPAGFWQALLLTLQLAVTTTLLLLLAGIPLAQWLNTSRLPGIWLLETLVSLPIVLPPTVIGFYLLVLLSPQQGVGKWWLDTFGHTLTFSFTGLVIGSLVYSLPFAVRPLQVAFRSVDRSLIEGSVALGATAQQTFWRIVLPASRDGVIAAGALAFAHTLGEFGVVLMVGGSIPGETRVASIALYDEAQKLNFATAHAYALVLLVISFVLLGAVTRLQRGRGW